MSYLRICIGHCLVCIVLLSGMFLAGCSGSDDFGTHAVPSAQKEEQIAAQTLPLDNPPYLIGAGDKIKITVFGETDLTKVYIVNNTGSLSFPLIGQIHADGLTLKALEDLLQDRLKEGYLKNPSISVEISEYRPFYVLGEVRNPGSYSYVAGMNVLKAAAIAGGYTYRADKGSIEILRKGDSGSKILRNMSGGTSVMPGDIILVKERFF